ncbi:MAG: hypothetical protein CR979_02490, partial [Propionibacterium sp.]
MLRRLLITATLTTVLLTGCTSLEFLRTKKPAADKVASALVTGLGKADLSGLPILPTASQAQHEYQEITRSLGEIHPDVELGKITYQDEKALADLQITYPIGDGWKYHSTAELRLVEDNWQIVWQPKLLHPQLTNNTKLVLSKTTPRRAAINGSNGLALVEQVPAIRIGLDKANLPKEDWVSSAKQLAKILKINAKNYVAKVQNSGDKAFVIAKVAIQGKLPPEVSSVKGVYLQETETSMSLSKTFAAAILGTTGQVTAETLANNGALKIGDTVGIRGLQARYDQQLRGEPGYLVKIVSRNNANPIEPKLVFEQKATTGEPLNLTMNADLQAEAEDLLANQSGVASLVALRASTGEILVAANSPAAKLNPFATAGHYPPGSTFKIVTTLALLRNGYTPETKVNCAEEYVVDGKKFTNYPEYPDDGIGEVPLAKAFAYSCNTAFLAAAEEISPEDLADAAASLGLGVQYDSGFETFLGEIPQSDNQIAKTAALIGQGQVVASPLAMATVIASAASGKTQVPWLIRGQQPTPSAKPLSTNEAQTLQLLLTKVVSEGTANVLDGVVTGAKTGTAQFGTEQPYQYHAWMLAYHEDIAVA